MSEPNLKLNKDVAGYLMLLILAESDGNFDKREGNVIVDYIKDKFPLGGNLDRATDIISRLESHDFEDTFLAAAQEFYLDSTKEERTDFLRFSMKLVRADKIVGEEENVLVTKLFEAWDV
jgi:uncharacterized tellurite resistance protein B-like protein